MCGDDAAFDFHPTLTDMLGATLIGDQVVQVGQPSQKRLLAPVGMMETPHLAFRTPESCDQTHFF